MNATARRLAWTSAIGGLLLAGIGTLIAQQGSGEKYVPKQSDRPSPIDGDEAGFKPIFDGKTLKGWEGDPKYWCAENGSLVGEITPALLECERGVDSR